MYKVDQSSYRAIQFILLCWVWIMGDVMSWSAEHRSVGIYSPELHISSEDKGEIIYFLIYVAVSEFGKKLDSKYVCPVYCGVNHKHRFRRYEAKQQEAIDEKTDTVVLGSVIITDR